MPKVSWVVSYEFCSKFHGFFQQWKDFESLLRFYKVTDSLTQCNFVYDLQSYSVCT